MVRSSPSSFVLAVLSAALVGSSLAAQCDFAWLPGNGPSGPNGIVHALLPLPTGDVIAAGNFVIADQTIVNHIARWDGTTWQALGSGASSTVKALARLPNGDIVAGGSFTTMGGQPSNHVARWNGSSWAPLGTGLGGTVEALHVAANGDLIAGGEFALAGGLTVNRIARWNGVAWAPLGTGFQYGPVYSIATLPNGDLVAGGDLLASGFPGVQRWNGTAWVTIPGFSPGFGTLVQRMAVLANGNLAIVGQFQINGATARLAIWDGVAMQVPLSPFPANVPLRQVIATSNGEMVVAGSSSLARGNGSSWTAIAGGPTGIEALAEDAAGRLLVGASAGGTIVKRGVSRYSGTSWQDLGGPQAPEVSVLRRLSNGDILVGGTFTSFEGVAANHIVRWNGSVWSPLGLGVSGRVTGIEEAPNGDVIVSGSFGQAGGAPANRIARWNGAAWSTLGVGLPAAATALAVAGNGDVFASANNLSLQRFDGLSWQNAAVGNALAVALSLVRRSNGDVVAAGVFGGLGPSLSGVAIYSNGAFAAIPGAPTTGLRALVRQNGRLLVVAAGQLLEWDGTSWTSLPPLPASVVEELPNGELVVGHSVGLVGGAAAASALYRLGASGWQSFGAIQAGVVRQIATSLRGDLFASGNFQTANGSVAFGFAHAVPTCPGAVTTFGSGCSGGAGSVTLATNQAPWLGGTFRATASGMTNNSLALQLFGVQPTLVPLPSGAPGCSLYVTPFVTDPVVPTNGVANGSFVVPSQPSLVGVQLRMQVLGLEFTGTSLTRLTGTNALDLTIGSL